jgi:hypothetical protein
MVYAWTMPVEAIGSKAFLAMYISYLAYGYMAILLLLAIRTIYLSQRLLRHISKRYPEEGRVIRSYEWQMYPWSKGVRVTRALIEKESVNDIELAQRAKKANRSWIYFLVWFAVGLIVFFVRVLLFLVT